MKGTFHHTVDLQMRSPSTRRRRIDKVSLHDSKWRCWRGAAHLMFSMKAAVSRGLSGTEGAETCKALLIMAPQTNIAATLIKTSR